MQIIHSSSLTHSAAASNQPQLGNTVVKNSVNDVSKPSSESDLNTSTTPVATRQQIESALNQAGWQQQDHQAVNATWAEKAVQTYTQTYRQAMQLHISETIAGIDLYA